MIYLIYTLVGVLYTIFNGVVRKMGHVADESPFIVFVWVFLWPVCLAGLFIEKLKNKI